MRRPVLLIFTNAMILIVIFALLTQSLVIVQRIAVTDKVTGNIAVQRSGHGAFHALALRDPIKTGDVVRSDKSGTVEFKWADGTRWKVMPGSVITVRKATYNMVKRVDNSQLQLTAGKVFIRIMKSLAPGSRFEVETPTAVAAVRGTIFSVAVVGGKTEVAVFKGHVKVTSRGGAGATAIIEPGQEAVSDQPGVLQTTASTTADAEFAQQSTIIRPELQASVNAVREGGRALVSGATEVGDLVTVNDQPIKTMGNGAFFKRVPLKPGKNVFVITSTDKHGEKSTLTRSLSSAQ